MATITAHFTNAGMPLTGPVTLPTVRIRRTDTQALVVTDAGMTEIGDGLYSYTFANDINLEYSIRADGDPLAAGQTTTTERYQFGCLDACCDKVSEIWQDHGLDANNPRVITENTVGTDYDEDTDAIHKDVIKTGTITTITRV